MSKLSTERHYWLAYAPSTDAQARLKQALDCGPIYPVSARVRDYQTYHITAAYFGALEDANQVQDVMDATSTWAQEARAVLVNLARLEVFTPSSYIPEKDMVGRILYAAPVPSVELRAVNTHLRSCVFRALGVTNQDKFTVWNPHVTIASSAVDVDWSAWSLKHEVKWPIDEVHLCSRWRYSESGAPVREGNTRVIQTWRMQ